MNAVVSPMRRVLLLGGTGYVGTRILDALRMQSGTRIMMLAHRNVPFKSLEDVDLIVDSLPRFELAWIERFRPDTIIHAARLGGRNRIGRHVAASRGRRANQRLVEWLAEHSPATRVLYVSGTLVYGDRGEQSTDESADLDPVAFAREYIEAERPWMLARVDRKLPVSIVRPPWIIGPGSWFQHFFVAPAMARGAVPVYGNGRNWMSFIDVVDCGRAIVHLAGMVPPGEAINLFAPGQHLRQIEFAECLAREMDLPIRHITDARSAGIKHRAAWEALTFSLKSATRHREPLADFTFEASNMSAMIARNLPVA